MKVRVSSKLIAVAAVMMLSPQIAPLLLAQTPAPATASQPAPVQLSVDEWNVLRMAHGNVGDATITAYIKNSGKLFPLGPSEILYLRDQGVSDQVITTMLEQPKTVAVTPVQPPAQVPMPAPPAPTASAPSAATYSPQPVAGATQAAPTYVQAAPVPVYAQPSPVYVSQPSYSYYDYWPYYGGYWGYPAISFSFGWGGHYGGYHGWGYHGGGHYGGGHFGGGFHGGGHFGGGHR